MRRDYSDELSPEVRVKMKKNLVYLGIFSVVMIFAGFTSAYIVSMGDTFWVKYPLPIGFWISTTSIIISSIFYHFACKNAKKQQVSTARLLMLLTLIFGIGFSVFQFVGYKQLIKDGAAGVSPIFVVDGRYGDYFEVKYQGKKVDVNGSDYLLAGKKMTDVQLTTLQAFVKPFETTADIKGYTINALNPSFELFYQNEKVTVQGGKLVTSKGLILQYTDMRRLQSLAWNIRDSRGDFFHKGELGKDFHVYYKGKELQYKNRALMLGKRRLSPPLQLKANQTRDLSTSYLYIITILHLLHIFGTSIYLLKMVVKSLKAKAWNVIEEGEEQEKAKKAYEKYVLSLRLGAIFWHFLGVLWIYLLIFLLYIH
jgi:cytochrome c oxidase subunit 3